jgi:hypothetical protein
MPYHYGFRANDGLPAVAASAKPLKTDWRTRDVI